MGTLCHPVLDFHHHHNQIFDETPTLGYIGFPQTLEIVKNLKKKLEGLFFIMTGFEYHGNIHRAESHLIFLFVEKLLGLKQYADSGRKVS